MISFNYFFFLPPFFPPRFFLDGETLSCTKNLIFFLFFFENKVRSRLDLAEVRKYPLICASLLKSTTFFYLVSTKGLFLNTIFVQSIARTVMFDLFRIFWKFDLF